MQVRSKRSLPLTGAATAGAVSLLFAGTVAASAGQAQKPGASHPSHGDSNRGDVWTDNVGQPAGPGHEHDPHLTCTDINIWGNGLGDSGGSYTIDGWPPSGSREVDYASNWSYDRAAAGTQVIAVVNVRQLIANATANGDAAQNKQGLHFKLDLSQDPQKHKTFWVSCAAPAPGPSPSPSPSPSSTPTPSPSPSPGSGTAPSSTPPSPSPRPGGGGSAPAETTAAHVPAAPASGVEAASTTGAAEVSGVGATTPGTGAALAFGSALLLLGGGLGAILLSHRMRSREI